MRKIEGLENELKKYFHEVEVAYDLENVQITDVMLVLRKNNVVYRVDLADNIFKYNPSIILNHLFRSMDYETLRSRVISLEEKFITDSLLEFQCKCCYVDMGAGCLVETDLG